MVCGRTEEVQRPQRRDCHRTHTLLLLLPAPGAFMAGAAGGGGVEVLVGTTAVAGCSQGMVRTWCGSRGRGAVALHSSSSSTRRSRAEVGMVLGLGVARDRGLAWGGGVLVVDRIGSLLSAKVGCMTAAAMPCTTSLSRNPRPTALSPVVGDAGGQTTTPTSVLLRGALRGIAAPVPSTGISRSFVARFYPHLHHTRTPTLQLSEILGRGVAVVERGAECSMTRTVTSQH